MYQTVQKNQDKMRRDMTHSTKLSVITHLNKTFMDYCGSGGNCAIDESMIKCESRLPYIIYQPQKPVCCGVQVFVQSNSPGYVQPFQIYVRSKLTKVSKNGLYFDVVNSLTKPLCGTYAEFILTMLTLVSQFYTTSKVTIYWHVVLSSQ